MTTIIFSLLGFIYIMLFPFGNVYVQIGAWLGFMAAGFLIDGIIMMVCDRIERKKKREKVLKKVLTNRQ